MSDTEARAREAAQLLGNPLLNEFLDALEANAVKSWLNTSDDQTTERERLYVWAVQARRLKAALQGTIDNAKFQAAKTATLVP